MDIAHIAVWIWLFRAGWMLLFFAVICWMVKSELIRRKYYRDYLRRKRGAVEDGGLPSPTRYSFVSHVKPPKEG